MSYIEAFDYAILRFMYNLELKLSFLKDFARFISFFGDKGLFFIAITLTLLMYKETRKEGTIVALSILISAIITNLLLKNLVARARPFTHDELKGYWQFAGAVMENSYSFPSGHTTISSAFSFAVLLTMKTKKRYLFLFVPFLMGISRMMLFVHYPTDVIGGLLVGLLGSFLALTAYYGLKKLSLFKKFIYTDLYMIPVNMKGVK